MQDDYRKETDALGEVSVAKDALWGAQTQRSLANFAIGSEIMHPRIIHAFALIKKACAHVNAEHQCINEQQQKLITHAADAVLSGKLSSAFPLKVWQTGSGTQTNMNVNEVLANIANGRVGEPLGSKQPVHPNDHVNCSQSSNDTFPTAMHIAFTMQIVEQLRPALQIFISTLADKSRAFANVIKIGRTHMQDAVPLTMGHVFSGYHAQLTLALEQLDACMPMLAQLAIGATAVGTGLNAPSTFGEEVSAKITALTGQPFVTAPNKYQALSAHNAALALSGCLKNLAASLYKIANDIRMLASGPRCGLGELVLPKNEPGSSIMPGKVNPTQCEALCMVAIQVFACDHAVTFAGSQGHFELNVNKPVIAHNILQALDLLSDAMESFVDHCLRGLDVNETKIAEHLAGSLMLVTALTPAIGYDKASQIALKAHEDNISLRQACAELEFLTLAEFDALVQPDKMLPHPE